MPSGIASSGTTVNGAPDGSTVGERIGVGGSVPLGDPLHERSVDRATHRVDAREPPRTPSVTTREVRQVGHRAEGDDDQAVDVAGHPADQLGRRLGRRRQGAVGARDPVPVAARSRHVLGELRRPRAGLLASTRNRHRVLPERGQEVGDQVDAGIASDQAGAGDRHRLDPDRGVPQQERQRDQVVTAEIGVDDHGRRVGCRRAPGPSCPIGGSSPSPS